MNPLDTAMQFYGLGVAAIPIKPRDKKPLDGFLWKAYQTRLPTPDDLMSWFNHPGNVGIVTGWQNMVVIDFDALDMTQTYGKWLSWAQRQGRTSPAYQVMRHAYKVQTARGIHVYVYVSQPERNRKLPGVDIKARNGYVLGEGSIHPSGAPYRALQPGLIIPTVQTLSDVLPTYLLLQAEQPAYVTPVIPSNLTNDPWQVLDQSIAITSHLVERIKKQWRITDFLAHTESTSADGRWRRCQCPLHDDNDPSFWIDTRDQVGGCFAGCTTKPLDVVNLYARLFGLSNRDAIFQLARMLP